MTRREAAIFISRSSFNPYYYYAACSGFPCDDGGCTSSPFDRCNGIDDCSDNSDESNCDGSKSFHELDGIVLCVLL